MSLIDKKKINALIFLQTNQRNNYFGFVLHIILLVGIMLPMPNKCLSQGITVNPSRIFFNLAPEQTSSQVIRITNPGNEPIVFNAYLKDWYRDSTGEKIYSDTGSLPTSNASWLRTSPSQLEIQPGQTKEVTVYMQVPADAKPVANSMLFLSQVNEQKPVYKNTGGRKVGIHIRLEVGVHIYNVQPQLSKKEFTFLSFEDLGLINDTTKRLAVKVKNIGEIPVDAYIRLELTNKATGDELKIASQAISMLPNAEQFVYFSIPAHLEKGKYLATAILDFGNDSDLKVAEKAIEYE